MDDDRGERGVRDVEEDGRQRVDCQQHDEGGNDPGERSSHPGFGLDGRPGERACSRIRSKKRAQQVRHPNGYHFLRGVDGVVVDAPKGLGNGDMLNEQNDHRGWQLARKSFDDGLAYLRNRGILKPWLELAFSLARLVYIRRTSGNWPGDFELVLLGRTMMPVDQPTDHGVKQDHEGRSKSGEEEEELGFAGHFLGAKVTNGSDGIEHEQSGHTHGGVEVTSSEMFEDVDDHFVRGLSRVESGDAHHRWELTNGDVNCRTRHERRNCRQRDEVNDPAHSDQTDEGNNRTADDCES